MRNGRGGYRRRDKRKGIREKKKILDFGFWILDDG